MRWNTDEINYLIENIGKLSYREIARDLNRTRASIRQKSNRLGIRLCEKQRCFIHKKAIDEHIEIYGNTGENNHNWKGGISENKYHYKKIQVQRYPEKIRARRILGYHVKAGNLKKEKCLICGSEHTFAHHIDYSRPLDVEWYCRKHHREKHDNKH